jgi:hypothetical protein
MDTAWTFAMADQQRFAALSGDFNPLHVDALAARRTMFGRPLVHGIHLVLRALEAALAEPLALARLTASFDHPVGVGEQVACRVATNAQGGHRIELRCAGARAARIDVATAGMPPGWQPAVPDLSPPCEQCRSMDTAEMASASGRLGLALDRRLAAAMFPRLSALLPPGHIAVLLATTQLVGMVCPGLHSIFSRLHLTFAAEAGAPWLDWRVEHWDGRFARATIALGGGAIGTCTAIVRPKPQAQPSSFSLQPQVGSGSFAGQRALVVGGSRGLGELTAKLLAAGGADVRLTYHQGDDDAQRVVADITAAGGRAECLALDVTQPAAESALGGFRPTHLYYYATPPISVAARSGFSADLFRRFCDFYVTGFAATVQAARRLAGERLVVFYPSTTILDALAAGLGEYAAAKAAGEAVCRYLDSCSADLAIHVARLPRLPTDQTASWLPLAVQDGVTALLGILLKLESETNVSAADV